LIECVVIGAGVVGLAVARELAQAGVETVVLERNSRTGMSTSSRNSEVVHAGIYYPPGSLKSELCVRGKHLLYRYCESKRIEHRHCGKLIVATSEAKVPRLHEIVANAKASGVDDLELLSRDAARAMEPNLECVAAVHSPSTGIVDSHGLMLGLQGDLERAGGMLAVESPVESGSCSRNGIRLRIGGTSDTEIDARFVINSAGLDAQATSRALEGLSEESIPPAYYAKGNYFSLAGKSPFSSLIYPVPEAAGLGVHLTLDLGGQVRFGPDVEWVDEIDYRVDRSRADVFYAEIRKYWPELADASLEPAYAGIRPKLHPAGQGPCDFLIQGPESHGIAGLVNLYGIESPGLTASMAIARHVRAVLLG
jgi:L-2-hydroxyglutarate oxidase LhgO